MALAPGKKTIILVRGLLGMLYSRGMDSLAAKLKARGCDVQVWNHSVIFIAWFGNVSRIAAEVSRLVAVGQTPILVGHSFGANTILMVARNVSASLPLLCAVDPAAQYDCGVPRNVKKALGFRQQLGAIGRGQLSPRGDPRITDILTRDAHVYIDDDPAVHSRIIAEIMNL